MSETLIVPTGFETLDELAEGLAERTDDGRLMLYGPDSHPNGAWVQFAVLYVDQSPAIQGVGRATASIDGGPDRPAAARWDVVLDSLRLDEASADAMARLLEVRRERFGTLPPEDAVDDGMDVELSGAEAVDDGASEDAVLDDTEGLVESVQPSVPPAAQATGDEVEDDVLVVSDVPEAPEALAAPDEGRLLTRPTRAAEWTPRAPVSVAPRPSTGALSHPAGELPVPASAPRPELPPERRIVRAPRPAAVGA